MTVFEALPTILSGCDEDVVKTVARSFRKRGIEVKTGVQLQGHTPTLREWHHGVLQRR